MSIQFFEKTVEKGLVPGINRRKQGFYQAVKVIFLQFLYYVNRLCFVHYTLLLFFLCVLCTFEKGVITVHIILYKHYILIMYTNATYVFTARDPPKFLGIFSFLLRSILKKNYRRFHPFFVVFYYKLSKYIRYKKKMESHVQSDHQGRKA